MNKLKLIGLAEGTISNTSKQLAFLSRHCTLSSPNDVALFIAEMTVKNSYKEGLVKSYNYYVQTNGLSWQKPKYKWEQKQPRIPTTEQIDKIIATASEKYSTIFTVLKETGMMPYELSQITRKDIDLEKGTINVRGFKGHASRVFKLKQKTVESLQGYLFEYLSEKPFPNSFYMGKTWRHLRNRLSRKLNDPALKNIRLYDLRHYFATMLYHRTRNTKLVKYQMGHKKLETIEKYTQLIDFEDGDWDVSTAKNLQDACKLIEAGFEYVTEMDGVKIFRKRK